MQHSFYFGVTMIKQAIAIFFYLHRVRIQPEVRKSNLIAVFQVYSTHFKWLCSMTVAKQMNVIVYCCCFFKRILKVPSINSMICPLEETFICKQKTQACNNLLIKWEKWLLTKHQNKKGHFRLRESWQLFIIRKKHCNKVLDQLLKLMFG